MEKMTTVQAINLALADAMEADENVILLGEDIADGQEGGVCGVTKGLSTRFGTSRVRSTPITEQAIVGAAIGSAIAGMRPVAEIMLMNFTTVAMDMIVNHAAKLRFMSGGQTHVPLVIRTMTGAGMGSGGQHSDFLEGWFAHTAGLKVVMPFGPSDAYGLMLSAIADNDPVIFVEHLLSYWTPGDAPVRGEAIPLGKAKRVLEGNDVTVVTYSGTVGHCLAAAQALAAENIGVDLIDLRTISPWDQEMVLHSAGKTGRVVVAHEALRNFGPGAEIAATIGERLYGALKAPIRRVGARTCPVPFSKPLETAFIPGVQDITDAIRSVLN
jgi:pyruvate dehydrogenase E1 component beta subunit